MDGMDGIAFVALWFVLANLYEWGLWRDDDESS